MVLAKPLDALTLVATSAADDTSFIALHDVATLMSTDAFGRAVLETKLRIPNKLSARVEQDDLHTHDGGRALGLSERMVRVLLSQWVQQGWLVVADPSRKKRAYDLSAKYRQFIGNPSTMKARR